MPDWINYYVSYTAGTSTSDEWINIFVPPISQVSQQYEEWKQERECQDQIYELQMQMHEQQIEEERQLIKDKEKYPLFFLKEGIV